MTDTQIFAQLKSILQENTSIKVEITPSTALLGDGLIDSMDFMNYITLVEERFGVAITDDEISAKKLGVVGNMVLFLHEKARSNPR